MPRVIALEPPFPAEEGELLADMMPAGVEPIALFRTFARNPSMARAMRGWGRYELSRELSVSMRDREIVIDRTTARCGCEYEWGVHIAFFAERVGLDASQITSLTHGSASDECWTTARDQLLIRMCDSLHDHSDIDDELWDELAATFADAELLDLLALAGWYHAISYVARAARVELEAGAPRFADVAD